MSRSASSPALPPGWPGRSQLAAWAGALALACLVAGCGSVAAPPGTERRGAAEAAGGTVPWISSSAPPYSPAMPLPARQPATSAPQCRAAHLDASEAFYSGLAGSMDYVVKITNVGPGTCLLGGHPLVVKLVLASGTLVSLPVSGSWNTPALEASDITAGGSGEVVLNETFNCTSSPLRYRAIEIGLPGGVLIVPATQRWQFPCPPISVSDFGVPVPPPAYRPDPMAALTARLVLPSSVHAGRLLDYVVDLGNPTSQVIALHPCPGYLEAFDLDGTGVKRLYALNCHVVGAIPAHGTVRFAMVVPVPAGQTGHARIIWDLAGAPVVTTGSLQILS
jgi:hypothetical protein